MTFPGPSDIAIGRRDVQLVELLHSVQEREHALRLCLVDLRQREANMHEHVLAGPDVGNVGKTHALHHPVEIHLSHEDAVVLIGLHYAAGNA